MGAGGFDGELGRPNPKLRRFWDRLASLSGVPYASACVVTVLLLAGEIWVCIGGDEDGGEPSLNLNSSGFCIANTIVSRGLPWSPWYEFIAVDMRLLARFVNFLAAPDPYPFPIPDGLRMGEAPGSDRFSSDEDGVRDILATGGLS